MSNLRASFRLWASMDRRKSSVGWKQQGQPGKGFGTASGCLEVVKIVGAKEQSETVYCARYSSSGGYAAASYGNGAVRVFETDGWESVQRLKSMSHNPESLAATCVRWRPHCPTKSYDMVVTCASGVIQQWGWDEGADDPEYIGSLVEDKNEVMCADYSPDGNLLASVGSDRLVRVYDTMSGHLQSTLEHGLDDRGYIRKAHHSRIFSARFVTQQLIVTAGWESACQVWDLRTGQSERQLLGTHVCADSLEASPNTSMVVVASYRQENQLNFFDYVTGKDRTPPNVSDHLGASNLYASKLAPNQTTLYCVGSKPNVLLAINIRTGDVIGAVRDFPDTCFTIDINPANPNEILVGGAHGALMIVRSHE